MRQRGASPFKRMPHMLGFGKTPTAEHVRLEEDNSREKNWKRWGPYLSERQWATVREDYSPTGECWDYFPHDHARSRAYRWGEDGLLGITDRQCRLCFALALWNGNDPILKERLFGLTGPEGNHGEDAKECYYYLDSTPTHSYMRALYKYPQRAYPYAKLVDENRRRGRGDREYELIDTGIFEDGRYFDVFAEYAKADTDDILIEITVVNRGPETARLHLLPTVWYRNTWSWGCKHEGCTLKPTLVQEGDSAVVGSHETLGVSRFDWEFPKGKKPRMLFTDNHTNIERLYGVPNTDHWLKDAFHRRVISGDEGVVNPRGRGTKVAAWYELDLKPEESRTIRMRLRGGDEIDGAPFGRGFERTFAKRRSEADDFYRYAIPGHVPLAGRVVARQAYAGLLWTKQFYHYIIRDWLDGDPDHPKPPASRHNGRNNDWGHLFSRDVLSMPDKWEYPWFAAWDLAFHMVPFSQVDAEFAKQQMMLLLREWYMHPNGQIPAYEFAFGDVNPPVHAWAAWRVYKITAPRGERDTLFLERIFQKLLMNFTWWVNRKDPSGKNIFSGGFLGLDNIGVFDRSQPLPTGGYLEQADGTAWMAFYCLTMLAMALELAQTNPAYEDIASKFFEHFVGIADAINTFGDSGLWDEEDGFYYDQVRLHGQSIPLRVRSLVGVISLFPVEVIDEEMLEKLPGFKKRMMWFMEHRPDLAKNISWMTRAKGEKIGHRHWLLALPSKDKLERVLRYLLDESEFLSPHGVRSLSRVHLEEPYVLWADGQKYEVAYAPGESTTGVFGGNSNWRGPIWFPLNYLLVEALERYHYFYGDDFKVECPVGSGKMMNLNEVGSELARRLSSIFMPDETGRRAVHGEERYYADRDDWKDLVLFYEYFHGDNGRGVGASHQTGWTALVARLITARQASGAAKVAANPKRK